MFQRKLRRCFQPFGIRHGILEDWYTLCPDGSDPVNRARGRLGFGPDSARSQLADRKIDVSVGDFNAPRRSLAFDDLPAGYRHGYDAAGAGWSYTWPMPTPFLAIDQCLIGPRLKPVHYELQSTLLSDHRLQVLDFEWLHEN